MKRREEKEEKKGEWWRIKVIKVGQSQRGKDREMVDVK